MNTDHVVIKGAPPIKNKLLMSLMFLRWPLYLSVVKNYIQKALNNCVNVDFFPGFQFFYGNIFAKDVYFCDTFIADYAPVYIGEGTKFSFQCMLLTSKHNKNDFKTIEADPIVIGKNSYIGPRTIVLGGSKIGDNVRIGAGSVVSGEIPSNCLAIGNPCKVIKQYE